MRLGKMIGYDFRFLMNRLPLLLALTVLRHVSDAHYFRRPGVIMIKWGVSDWIGAPNGTQYTIRAERAIIVKETDIEIPNGILESCVEPQLVLFRDRTTILTRAITQNSLGRAIPLFYPNNHDIDLPRGTYKLKLRCKQKNGAYQSVAKSSPIYYAPAIRSIRVQVPDYQSAWSGIIIDAMPDPRKVNILFPDDNYLVYDARFIQIEVSNKGASIKAMFTFDRW